MLSSLYPQLLHFHTCFSWPFGGVISSTLPKNEFYQEFALST